MLGTSSHTRGLLGPLGHGLGYGILVVQYPRGVKV